MEDPPSPSAAGNAHQARNPTWSRDELILALSLYMTNPASPPRKGSIEVDDLSALLNRIGNLSPHGHQPAFRNANGVYMKMMNFRRFDPAFVAEGRVGLSRGGKDEERVWEEFASDLPRLRQVAAAIRQAAIEQAQNAQVPDLDIAEAEEGRVLTSLHSRRERSRELVAAKKRQVLRDLGRLACEACGFDFGKRYGARGEGLIEIHHTQPLHTLAGGAKTRLEDLAVLCANCHRVVHAKAPWLSMAELKALTCS